MYEDLHNSIYKNFKNCEKLNIENINDENLVKIIYIY